MPRIPAALAVAAVLTLCIGFNVARYPAVRTMAGAVAWPRFGRPAESPAVASAAPSTEAATTPVAALGGPDGVGSTADLQPIAKAPPPAAEPNPPPIISPVAAAPPPVEAKPAQKPPPPKPVTASLAAAPPFEGDKQHSPPKSESEKKPAGLTAVPQPVTPSPAPAGPPPEPAKPPPSAISHETQRIVAEKPASIPETGATEPKPLVASRPLVPIGQSPERPAPAPVRPISQLHGPNDSGRVERLPPADRIVALAGPFVLPEPPPSWIPIYPTTGK
jgi:hypothetical protein